MPRAGPTTGWSSAEATSISLVRGLPPLEGCEWANLLQPIRTWDFCAPALITLHGMGGTGKTRLGMALAAGSPTAIRMECGGYRSPWSARCGGFAP